MSKLSESRHVTRIIEPVSLLEGAGVRIKRSIGSPQLNTLDPFLLLDEFKSDNPDDYIRGFPDHPHRGIETVTYMLHGVMQHWDSIGNSGNIEQGDAQWMTSGRGIIHSEMPNQRDGLMWGYQLWVNLPAKDKMSPPHYQNIPATDIVLIEHADGTRIRLVTGQFDGHSGPVTGIAADPLYMEVMLPPGKTFSVPTKPGYTVFTYVVAGQGKFGPPGSDGTQTVTDSHLVLFGDGDSVMVQTDEKPVRFLLAAGKPFHEPIARYGPFVMNTQEEIEQALEDLQNGTFLSTGSDTN